MESTEDKVALEDDFLLRAGNFNLYVCLHGKPLELEKAIIYDAIIIEAGDQPHTLNLVRKVRSHLNPECYLKPIFLYKGSDNRDVLIHNLTDGVIFSLDQTSFLIPVIEKIYLRIADLTHTKSISFEAQMIDKCLNLLYTRQKIDFPAIMYIGSSIGYTFPELSVNFHLRDEWQVLDVLNIMESEGLVQGDYTDRIYQCNQCSSGYLIYREVCPTCNSTNCSSEDLIHHYPCAFIGPISDFKNELDSQLHCPKCNKNLKHIGVDYDKPSIIYTCKNCNGRFQDINVKAKCVLCLNENEIEKLVTKEIKNYRLTKKGETAATTGYVSTAKDIEEFIGTIKIDTFRTMVKYEVERLKQNDYNSNLACIYLKNAGGLYSMIGANSQRALLKDLVDVVRRNLRSSDLISFMNANSLLIQMNEIPVKIAEHVLAEICDIMKRLISKNFKNYETDIRYKVVPITTRLSHELQIQQLTNEFQA
jgi:hypothetical protein